MVYLATSPAGALVEVLVHLELDPQHLPASYKMLKAEAPDAIQAAPYSPRIFTRQLEG